MISVEFESLYETNGDYNNDEDICPYIHIADPRQHIAAQRAPNEVVIPMQTIRIKYDYPLSVKHIVTHKSADPRGFTRADLARQICAEYQRIYAEEERVAGDPGTVTPMMLNRAKSKGPYGIWGHYIDDLDLCGVTQINGDLFGLNVDS